MKAIINGRLILPDEHGEFQIVDHQALLYDQYIARIVPEMGLRGEERDNLESVIDARGGYVSPGFINVHLHGCVGCDTMDETADSLRAIAKYQASTGVTAMLPTTMTYDFPRIYRAFNHIREVMGEPAEDGARVLGAHMEGPFISMERRGAQAPEHIAPADFSLIEEYKDVIRIITIAPEELKGDYGFVEECQKYGIVISLGHSSADYNTARRAILQYGIDHVTHLFNGMVPFHHRTPGLVGAALDTPVDCEIIADNIHLHPMTQRLVWRMKQGHHIILITDSMRACGLGDGESELGGQVVRVSGQVATLADGTIAGSVLTLDRAVANFAANTGAGIAMTVSYATKVPAQGLGVYDQMGSLTPGKRADITVFDGAVRVQATIVGGKLVYSADGKGEH
ncbi:MAG: N-acetylglucosamine-6-phosphate deacetylase [Schwartzia sp.]|jgi:N-acetylglucosamine-6-phosphate deacetylase|nr:N-acetylglucosamine-6-phosphate deacetylase [Schwartzia sp. (in: firmicutes)]MBQ1917975.1 N-acetylglucosamine-6-phosphate deacetylase [Schwartzia sp. (in: firmicutes)]MBQ4152512.1 N-acetylglucosamine-6-phosphate deacetylase [Schwartzia sp. (in: firmicutes)]